MASKRNKKPDQEIYRPPNSENIEKPYERTFYNSNHRRNNHKPEKKEDEMITKSLPNSARINYKDVGPYSNRRYENYVGDYRWKEDAEQYYNDYYYHNSYNERSGYGNRQYASYKHSQKYDSLQYHDQYRSTEDKSKHKTDKSRNKKSEPIIKEINVVKPVEAAGQKIEQKKTYEQSPRSRQNSHTKDFNDSRLFNPYKEDNDGSIKLSSKTGICQESHINDKNDSHIHGGLIHLPENLEINTSVQPTSSKSVYHNTEAKWCDNKPTVIVRPTFSQLVTSSSIQFPTVSVVAASITTIPTFVPLPQPYICPPNMNIYCTQSPPLSTQQALRYPPMIQSPDDTHIYQVSNIVSKFPIVVQSINTIKTLEAQLDGFIRSTCDITSTNWWTSVNQIRNELKTLYKIVITNDLDYCNQAGIEQNLWKSVFYSIMELIRTYISNPDTLPLAQNHKDLTAKIQSSVIRYGATILQSGEEFFINLYTELSKSHSVDLEAIFNSRRPPPETSSRTRKLVYLSAQKLLLFLGDLTRYSEIINNTSDYSKARIWYMKAQLLVPKNGRPYNQLAVISIYANRHLDALYYYTRTLAASNPFSTASQSLSFLFEEARRKGDEVTRRNQESLKRKKKKLSSTNNDTRRKGCIEIWIHPGDGTKDKKVTDDDDTDILATFDNNDESKIKAEQQLKEDFLSIPLIELSKLFTLSFLNSQGKIFGKINMENFPEVCSTMLQELWGIISHQPCPLTSFRLCHMLIINMYIMDRVSQQMLMTSNHTLRSLHQDHASRMTLDFFALLCQRAIELLKEWLESDSNIVSTVPLSLPKDLSALLAPICLWTDWMVTHPEYWNPPPSHRDPLLLPSIDDFGLIAELCTQVNILVEKWCIGFPRPVYRILSDSKDSEKAISDPKSFILLEESLISGFLPMLDQTPKIYSLEDNKWNKEQTEDWIHLEKIALFGDFLCGITPQFLDYDNDTCTYVSTMTKECSEMTITTVNDQVKTSKDEVNDINDDLDLKLQMAIDEINTTHCTLGDDKLSSWADLTEQAEEEEREHQRRIASLKIKRANIKFKDEKNRRFELWRKTLLDHEIAQRFVELEIRPLFLVLDTNCYIDYLTEVDHLIDHRRFIIVVPLIVVNELENLSKCSQNKDDVDVNCRAKHALKLLEDRFERGDQNVKAITSRGNFMETIAFRAEALNMIEGETNDDVILNCCQFLCKDKASEFMPRDKDKPITLYREVVLLTGDRNLRLKALSRHIPVKPLMKFMYWADIKRKYK